MYKPKGPADGMVLSDSVEANVSAPQINQFTDLFNTTQTLQEAGSMATSASKDWWLNSGGMFTTGNGIGATIQGSLSSYSYWRIAYFLANPTDTDNGYHPQNIFRLVTRTSWLNLTQQAYFKINNNNLSSSPQRNASNGLFFFNRYLDGQNLYYTGIRVDGGIVIKKKYKGIYYTMSYKKYFSGNYNINSSPNLLPMNKWIGIRSVVSTDINGIVHVSMYLDLDKSGNWIKVIEASDTGSQYGSAPILTRGFGGIRTDFMDVSFSEYKIQENTN